MCSQSIGSNFDKKLNQKPEAALKRSDEEGFWSGIKNGKLNKKKVYVT